MNSQPPVDLPGRAGAARHDRRPGPAANLGPDSGPAPASTTSSAAAALPPAANPAPQRPADSHLHMPRGSALPSHLPGGGVPPVTDELGRPIGSGLPPDSKHTFVLHWCLDTIRFEDGTLVYRVVGMDFVHTDVCFFCRSEQEARTLLALVDGVCTTHTVIKTQSPR